MQPLGQLLLGQALSLALFGDVGAEGLFVQSDHLAIIVAAAAESATDRWFTCRFFAFSAG